MELLVPDIEPLASLVQGFDAYLHRDQRQVEVLRGVTSSEVSLLYTDGREESWVTSLTRNGESVLLGGAFDVDALRFLVDIDTPHELWRGPLTAELRTSYLRHTLVQRLRAFVNPFLATWIHDVAVTALLQQAVQHEAPLQQSWFTIRDDLATQLDATLEVLFSTTELELGEGDQTASPRKLRDRLRKALSRKALLENIDAVIPVLWEAPGRDAQEWLKRRLVRTVGELLLNGAALLCPEHDPESVVLDIVAMEDHHELWISEQVVGGGGFLEAVVDACAAEPDRLFRLGRASLRPGAQELVAASLEKVVQQAVLDGSIRSVFALYRKADDAHDRAEALRGLRDALKSAGMTVTPDVVGAVVNRLLRAGSTHQLDETIADSLSRWIATEQRLGFEVPVRTWSFLEATKNGQIDTTRLERLQTILWPRGASPRNRRFSSYNPFSDEPDPAPTVLEAILAARSIPRINAEEPEPTWNDVSTTLQRDGVVLLEADDHRRSEALDVLARTTTEPIELEHLRINSRVTDINVAASGELTATIGLPLLGRWRSGDARHSQPTPIHSRRVMTSGQGRMSEVEQLHHLFFLMELIAPSDPLWVVSAWLSDVPVIDNRGGELLSIAKGLPTRRLGIVEVLTELVGKGGDVRVIVRDDEHNRMVAGPLQQLARRTTAGSIHVEMRADLHDKTIVSERMSIEGSMNLTHRGALRNEEGVRVVTDRADIAAQRSELIRRFGAGHR